MLKNKYKCSVKIWSKFSKFEKCMFNIFFEEFNNINLYAKGLNPTKEQLHITAHNTSCLAVWCLTDLLNKAFKK